MDRRKFSQLSVASTLALLNGRVLAQDSVKEITAGAPFKANFAPEPQHMVGEKGKKFSYLDKISLAHDLGFRAWEDNWLKNKKNKELEKIANRLREKEMTMGVSVITIGKGILFNKPTEKDKEVLKKDLLRGVELAKITGQTNMTMLTGARDKSITREEQIKASVDTMKWCCDLVEEHGIILAQEPVSHPIAKKDPLLRSFADGHLLCSLVDRKSCKLLADFYHEGEIGNGGKLVEIAEEVWDQVSYVQFADSPGRKEPGTGKLELAEITKFLRSKNYQGIIGMEHQTSIKGPEGVQILVDSYRKIDA